MRHDDNSFVIRSLLAQSDLDFEAKHSRLPAIYNSFGMRYQRPACEPWELFLAERQNSPLKGTAATAATVWAGAMMRYRRFRESCCVLFEGAQVHCSSPEAGGDCFPIEVRHRVVHFFQSELAWRTAGQAWVLDFFTSLLFQALSSKELEAYEHDAVGGRGGHLVEQDFKDFAEAVLTDNRAFLDEHYHQQGEPFVRQRLAIINDLLKPDVLRSRLEKRIVTDFRLI